MLVEFGKAGFLDKARSQPDKVRQVVQKLLVDGVVPTLEAVMSKLDEPLPLGYCNVGIVAGVGTEVTAFNVGDRVVSNGHHSEYVVVNQNLCAKVPENVEDEPAAFTVLGAIALQSVRLASPTLGESFAVFGLGLVGLLVVQILRANGCKVLGLDYDPKRLDLARAFGADVVNLNSGEPLEAGLTLSRGMGMDGAIVATATQSDAPIKLAADMSRKRGRIVLVGVAGLHLQRDDFFKKELTFQVSASYGPGRYESKYEEKSFDYPIGFVRWTEQRNFEAFLDLLAFNEIETTSLVSHRYNFQEAVSAYETILDPSERSLGVVLEYQNPLPVAVKSDQSLSFSASSHPVEVGISQPVVSFIGAGSYAAKVLLPRFKDSGCRLKTIASKTGLSATYLGKKFGFEVASSDTLGIFNCSDTNTIVIASRHDTHAKYVLEGLKAGKNVFVEKPLCLNKHELDQISSALAETEAVLMVGFNRRFSPLVSEIKKDLKDVNAPRSIVITINAGTIDSHHWTQDSEIGGGRLIGEVCHFVDLLHHLTDSKVTRWSKSVVKNKNNDGFILSCEFTDGSVGVINYLTDGNNFFPKERIEVFVAGRIYQLNNFRNLKVWGSKSLRGKRLYRQNKGQAQCIATFVESVSSGVPAISREDILNVSALVIEMAEMKR